MQNSIKVISVLRPLLFVSLSISLFAVNLAGQTEQITHKGEILVETGYGIINNFLGGQTGFGVYLNAGSTSTNVSFEGGYFISDRMALKGRFGIISSGSSLTALGIGMKYYFPNKILLQAIPGFLASPGGTVFSLSFGGGYAIPLASNILLEPRAEVVVMGGSAAGSLGIVFSLLL